MWRWLSDANSKEPLKRLLTVFCFVLLARSGVADQRTANAALERATNAFNQGRFEEAEKQVDAAARADSKKPEIPNLRGAIFTKQKRYDEAVQQFNQALALDPKFYPAKLNLAEVKLLEGKYVEATQEYQALKEIGSRIGVGGFQACAVCTPGGRARQGERDGGSHEVSRQDACLLLCSSGDRSEAGRERDGTEVFRKREEILLGRTVPLFCSVAEGNRFDLSTRVSAGESARPDSGKPENSPKLAPIEFGSRNRQNRQNH